MITIVMSSIITSRMHTTAIKIIQMCHRTKSMGPVLNTSVGEDLAGTVDNCDNSVELLLEMTDIHELTYPTNNNH